MAYTTIDDPTAYFQTVLYTGNATARSITNTGNSDLQPDWIWIKSRSTTHQPVLTDSVRGTGKELRSDTADPESSLGNITAFNSDGFSIGTRGEVNNSGSNFVAWQWKKVAGVFDIQTYSGASNTRTISHNLGVVPKAMLFKRLDDGAWIVYHVDAGGADKYLVLNTNAAVDTATTLFNNTVPTSSVFSVGNTNSTNGSDIDYVVYLFGNKQGVSKCGSYTGNGNADGPMIVTGMKPAWLLIKETTQTRNWVLYDNKRVGYNPNQYEFLPDTENVEDTSTTKVDLLSNGFKIRASHSTVNQSGETYIYIAFAENPFVTSTGVPATAR